MTKEEAIKYLQQLYPNGGHCWLDEQRIEAIGMAVKALQEEPVSEPQVKESLISIHDDKTCKENGNSLTQEPTIPDIVDEHFYEMLGLEPVSNPIDFEQELYKAFGQVKDFTLGMQIAKWFYDMGKNSQEPLSEDLNKAANAT